MDNSFYFTGYGAVDVRGSSLNVCLFGEKILTASFTLNHPLAIQKALITTVSTVNCKVLVADVLTTTKDLYRFYKRIKHVPVWPEKKENIWQSELVPSLTKPYQSFTEESGMILVATDVMDIYHGNEGVFYSFCNLPAIFTPDDVDYDASYISPEGCPSSMVVDHCAESISSHGSDIIFGIKYEPRPVKTPRAPIGYYEDLGFHEPPVPSEPPCFLRQPSMLRYVHADDPSRQLIDQDRSVKPGCIFFTRAIGYGVFIYQGNDDKFYLYDPYSHPATNESLTKPDYLTRSRTIELTDVKRIWVTHAHVVLWKENGETEFFLNECCEKFIIPDLLDVNASMPGIPGFLVLSNSAIQTLRGKTMTIINLYGVDNDKETLQENTIVRPPRIIEACNYYFTVKQSKIWYHQMNNTESRALVSVEPGETVYLGACVIIRGEHSTYYLDALGKRILLSGSQGKKPYKINYGLDLGQLGMKHSILVSSSRQCDLLRVAMIAAQQLGICEKNAIYSISWRIVEEGKVLHSGDGVSLEMLSRLGEIIREKYLEGERFVHWSSGVKELTKNELYLLGMVLRMISFTGNLPRMPITFLLAINNLEWMLCLHRTPTIDDYEYFARTFDPDAFANLKAICDSPEMIKECGFDTYHAALAHYCEMNRETFNIRENNQIAKGFLGEGFTFFTARNLGSINAYFTGDPEKLLDRSWQLGVSLPSGFREKDFAGKIEEFKTRILTLSIEDHAVLIRNWTGKSIISRGPLLMVLKKRKPGRPDFIFRTCEKKLEVCQDLFDDIESLLEALCRPETDFQLR